MSADIRFTLDTNLLIYATDKRAPAEKRKLAMELVGRSAEQKQPILLQTLNEFSRATVRKQLLTVSQAESFVRMYSSSFLVVAGSLEDTMTAFRLQREHLLSHWDAVLLATAKRARCEVLLSEDLEDGKRYDSLLVVNPFGKRVRDLNQLLSAS